MTLSTDELRAATADTPLRTLLVAIGTTHKRWTHYTAHGIPMDLADRWAERIGAHPAEVWGNWIDVVLAA